MLAILRAYGVPEKLVTVIGHTYDHTIAHVTSPDGVTEDFDIQAGVPQGDTLAPFLFIIVLDYVLRKTLHGHEDRLGFTLQPRTEEKQKNWTSNHHRSWLCRQYSSTSCSIKGAEELLHLVIASAMRVCLGMNAKETKAMVYNELPHEVKTLDGSELEIVHDF